MPFPMAFKVIAYYKPFQMQFICTVVQHLCSPSAIAELFVRLDV